VWEREEGSGLRASEASARCSACVHEIKEREAASYWARRAVALRGRVRRPFLERSGCLEAPGTEGSAMVLVARKVFD
jgi:hypothetical protein